MVICLKKNSLAIENFTLKIGKGHVVDILFLKKISCYSFKFDNF